MQEKTYNFFQILGFYKRKGRFSCSFLLKEKNQKFKFILFFWLDPKEPKSQGCACFATHSLHSAARAANSPSAQTSDAHGRSISVARLTLTSRRPILAFLPASTLPSLPNLLGREAYYSRSV